VGDFRLLTIGTFDATGPNVSYRGAAQERSTTDLGRISDGPEFFLDRT